ncbi:phenylacetate-CoA oxygenase subunit PaaI [Elizabethkingia meningoseptica]|uniref:Phenylacetate-CoA oxygenase subunit PaaI n=1 Tax=Elizabethkingia meningoseptica TaxID=238 RepID=A0A1T3FAA1_ELIME|nr:MULTISPECIES: 1,2-phenylacetyl-CoA epoxidase subunit PaaC [Elizabethkingia]AQX12298.1 phenylacetate-CoA oxygenase subunit PaaI [Elizabethkingia meningoseptica]MBG0513824.1 phenylacetate-CoA oxygenase subunit PaaC [Elizabethkingia meningoseptica]MDE5432468.1 phenylacetate-CoA oxygenase subunit PaaC [Elizabethkingia meningoseptica]MDE5436269.1 phenylacetate-CoA oxygenase subunit PaaC [Elizabethkingia meningoseptica]MDE5450212.1 phenylacetate-CoA oxygenase subunit PaaC [Elizabethkingia meningo
MNPLYNYLLKLADDSFIMGQRLAEWCGKGPYLEEDIALTNIALDELGQANNFYQYASRLTDDGKSEDDLAFLRYEHEYVNAHWVELPNEDYAQTILKVYIFSVYQKLMYEALSKSADEDLSAIAQKSLKEVKYHYTHTSSWMRIFAQGTEESRERLVIAIENIWEYTKGLFAKVEGEDDLAALNIVPDTDELYEQFIAITKQDFQDFGLEYPENPFMQLKSRTGYHTEYFGYILCELQYMQRAYPGCTW